MDIKSALTGKPDPTRRDWADRIAVLVFVLGSVAGVAYVVANPFPVQPATSGSVSVWDRIFASPEITLLWIATVVVGSFLLAAIVQRVIMGRLEFKAGPVESAPLPEVVQVRSDVEVAIAAEVERLKTVLGEVAATQRVMALNFGSQITINDAVTRMLDVISKDVASLKNSAAPPPSG